jgi:hypothetical protein
LECAAAILRSNTYRRIMGVRLRPYPAAVAGVAVEMRRQRARAPPSTPAARLMKATIRRDE